MQPEPSPLIKTKPLNRHKLFSFPWITVKKSEFTSSLSRPRCSARNSLSETQLQMCERRDPLLNDNTEATRATNQERGFTFA